MFIFHKKLRDIPLTEKLATFYHALRLDLSMTAYIAVIPILVFLFFYLAERNQVNFKWVNVYNKVLIVLFSFISILNFNIFRELGSKINAKTISFAFDKPNEVLASSASSAIFSLFIFIVILLTGLYLNFLIVKPKISFAKTPIMLKIVTSILLIGINFLLIRGGWRIFPNTQNMAYFSKNELLNHTSLNTEWNLFSSIINYRKSN
jgi:hypothetical protein